MLDSWHSWTVVEYSYSTIVEWLKQYFNNFIITLNAYIYAWHSWTIAAWSEQYFNDESLFMLDNSSSIVAWLSQ